MGLFDFLRGTKEEKKAEACFFERGRNCDVTCRAYTERMTCAIQDRLKETQDPRQCAAMLQAMCAIDRDPDRLARDHPELFPPPNLVYED